MPPPATTVAKWNEGRIHNLPGMNRTNAPSKPVDSNLIQRISGSVRNWLGMTSAPTQELPFFPPGKPLDPIAPSAVGRRFDYPTNFNATIRPRTYEPVDFETLRALADPGLGGWDLIRMAVETRKDQMSKLTFSVLPRKPANETLRPKSTPRCQQIESFLQRPDGEHSWETWTRMLLDEHLVIDAATIYRHPTIDGGVAKLQLLDGATIQPILAYDGRRPPPGQPAYSQILKGLPAVQYTADELIYAPRNPRVYKVYGYSPVEQVLVTINIGLRRQASQLGYFTEGSVPDAVAACPPDWDINKIQAFQDYWDTIVNDSVRRRKLKFIPGGVAFQATRNDQALVDQFDEWLARVVQYCFSLPPTPLVRMLNRATSENAYEQSLDEGLQPLMMWVKNLMDDIITRWFNAPELEFVWDDIRKVDPAEKEERDIALANEGGISLDDIRADRGMEPMGIEPFVKGIGPLGFLSVKSMIKAMQNGWDLTGMPQPGLPGMPGAPGMPGMPGAVPPGSEANVLAELGTGSPNDPLAGLPPDLLDALGIQTAKAPDQALRLQREAIAGNSNPTADMQSADGNMQSETANMQAASPSLHPAMPPGIKPAHQTHLLNVLAHGEKQARRMARPPPRRPT